MSEEKGSGGSSSAFPLTTEYQLANAFDKVLVEHKEQIDELLAKYGDKESDTAILYRFLKAFEFDMKQAEDNLINAIKWKEENNFKELMEKTKDMPSTEFPHGKDLARFAYECEDYCEDISGNPVSFTRIARLDPVTYMGNISPEMLVEYATYMFAKKIGLFKRLTQERKYIVRGIRIWDLQGLGMNHMSADMLRYLTGVLGPAQKNFPEHMYKGFMINAPSIFSIGWAIIKPMLPERSAKKIVILGSDYRDTLLQYISEDQLPIEYGGKNEKAVWPQSEENFTKTTVPARGNIKLDYKLKKGAKAVWDFRTIYADVGFEVKFVPEGGKAVSVFAYQRVESFKKIVRGEYVAETEGTIFFSWDNSYSMFTGKELIYLVEVIEASS